MDTSTDIANALDRDIAALKAKAADFDAQYPLRSGRLSQDSTDSTLRIPPPPLRSMTGANARIIDSVPK